MAELVDAYTDARFITPKTLRDWGVSVPVECHWGCGGTPVLAWQENGHGAVVFACAVHAARVPVGYALGQWVGTSKARHTCDPDGKRLDSLGWPLIGSVAYLPEVDMYGRVRLVWGCCGAVLVEAMRDDSPECADTYTMRCTLGEIQSPPPGRDYSVPCVGAEWPLMLPCGHLNGEGCDCDTIEAEAAGQDTCAAPAPTGDAAPVTYAGVSPAGLVGRLVRVRPYYLTRDRRSTRARRTVPARVEEVFGSDMVIVIYAHHTGDAPWPMRQSYYPHELHHPHGQCLCPGCAGGGIREHHGA